MLEPTEKIAQNTLNLFHKGIIPFIIKKYRNAFGDEFDKEIISIKRKHHNPDFTSPKTIQASIDIQLCVDLILKKEELFLKEFQYSGFIYLAYIKECRNKISHQNKISFKELNELVEYTKSVLTSIDATDEALEVKKILGTLIEQQYDDLQKKEGSNDFPNMLKINLKEFNIIVENATIEQYEVLKWMRSERKATISGCAGTGKTLLAVQKAIAFDEVGLKTLLLCHNPFLSEYLQKITKYTQIIVFDFVNWVKDLCNLPKLTQTNWHVSIEPLDKELEIAINKFLYPSKKIDEQIYLKQNQFDAIIVDEGQDFKEEWWLLVLASLRDYENSFLYIFHDDNQLIIPKSVEYPIKAYPILLSKNCRNGGEIFNKVRQYYLQYYNCKQPVSAPPLAKKGILKETRYKNQDKEKIIQNALIDALKNVIIDDIVVLSTIDDIYKHDLIEMEICLPPDIYNCWQDVIKDFYSEVLKFLGEKQLTLTLSESLFPKLSDIYHVSKIFRDIKNDIYRCFINGIIQHRRCTWNNSVKQKLASIFSNCEEMQLQVNRTLEWVIKKSHLELSKYNDKYYLLQVINFFSKEDWASKLPSGEKIKFTNLQSSKRQKNEIYLTTVNSFKGLESNAIILLDDNSNSTNKLEMLYIGTSRAKYYLNILTNEI